MGRLRIARLVVGLGLGTLAPIVAGCASAREAETRGALSNASSSRARAEPAFHDVNAAHTDDGSVAGYVAAAITHSPSLEAAFERWRAEVQRISKARRLPEPTISFSVFVQGIETRVGPQEGRISLQQAFPWPTSLSAGADAASSKAVAMQRLFEAEALTVTQTVHVSYWNLWQVRAVREVHRAHLAVVADLAQAVSARVSTGAASLADLQAVELTAARLRDRIAGMDEREHMAEAQLLAAVGDGRERFVGVATSDAPVDAVDPVVPVDTDDDVVAAARVHPRVTSAGFLADGADAIAEVEGAQALPSFSIGADWFLIGEAQNPAVVDSGKDAFAVGGGVRVPLWQGSYADSVDAARADARAKRAEQRALADAAAADAISGLSSVRDAARRVTTTSNVLLPQAEDTYTSVLGSYAVGRNTAAEVLLAQRDVLDLRVDLAVARADYARAWATLERVTGQALRRGLVPAPPEPKEEDHD